MPVNIIVCLQLGGAGSNIAQAQENKPQQRFTKQILDLLIDEADDVIELIPVDPPAKKLKQSSIADYFCKQFLDSDPVTTNKRIETIYSVF